VNILFIAYNVNIYSRTGDAVHVRELVSNLAALGNKISLVVGFDVNSKEDISFLENDPNVNIYYAKNPRFKYPRSKDISILSLCSNLAKNDSPNIIYERNFSCRIGSILSRTLRIPLVVEINGLVDEEAEMQGRSISLAKKFIGKTLRQIFFMQPDRIVTVSEGIKKEINKQYRIPLNKIYVVPNGADIRKFKPMNRNEIMKELGLSSHFKYICFVGNLAPWQGVDHLIRTAPLILEKCPKTRFLIVGDGIMKADLEKLAGEYNVRKQFLFIGSVPFDMVPLYINASDICVAPFTRERNEKIGLSPLKIYEYLACGKPIVASNVKGVADLLEKSKGGIVVSFEDPRGFANVILSLLKNEDLRINMGKNGHKYIKENHSWEIVAKNVAYVCNL